jgi:hypothetical protein
MDGTTSWNGRRVPPAMKQSARDLMIGGGLIIVAMVATFVAMGRATLMFVLGLAVAYVIWAKNGPPSRRQPRGLLRVYLAGLVVIALHVCEEFSTGFQHQFPALVGDDWSDERFVVFNSVWLAAFALAAVGLSRRMPLAYLVAWSFALVAGIGNGVGHLLLSLSYRRYFPGTLTAPLCLLVGVLLVRELTAKEEAA